VLRVATSSPDVKSVKLLPTKVRDGPFEVKVSALARRCYTITVHANCCEDAASKLRIGIEVDNKEFVTLDVEIFQHQREFGAFPRRFVP
jgi:hypothetical protein